MTAIASLSFSPSRVWTVGPLYRGQTQILGKISLPVIPGQWIAIMGRSGVGKTTFLRALAGLEPQSPAPVDLRVSYIPQRDALLPWKTVAENIALAHLLQGHKIERDRIDHYLDVVDLKGYQNHYPHQLSQGMRQRIALARALFDEAELILMDEPFSSLDSLTRADLHQSIKNLLAGKTVVLVTHDVHEACHMTSHIYLLKHRPGTLTPVDNPTPNRLLEALSL